MTTKVSSTFRLSPQQRHLWLLHKVGQSLPYHAQCAVRIEGNLNEEIFQAALNEVVNQHEILRTGFSCSLGMDIPFQVINDSSLISLKTYDLSGVRQQEQKTKLEAIVNHLNQQNLDLSQDSLLHFSLVTLALDKYVLFINMSALSADTASLRNLVNEIIKIYSKLLINHQIDDEPLQYADISEIFNELTESEDTQTGIEYWRKQNLSTILNLKLPYEKQPIKNGEFKPQVLRLRVDQELKEKIAVFAQQYNTSFSFFFLACWQILLWRLTEKSDALIAMGYDGRTYEGLEEALGLFGKYLPIRCSIKENVSFFEILNQLKESIKDVYQWQDYFAWEHIEVINKNNEGQLFFPFCFDYEEEYPTYSTNNISFSIYKQYSCFDRYKVKLSCVHEDSVLFTDFYYDEHWLTENNIQRLGEHFYVLLNSILEVPYTSVDRINILSDGEREKLLFEFNSTQVNYPKDQLIHQLFEQQTQHTPDKIAVVFENQQLTYAELNQRANQLAHYLQKLGVGPEVMVGICVERSLEMLVGLLGILKAGGAYVPLDPTYPKQRLAFMLADSQVPVLLTQQRLIEVLPEYTSSVVYLDTDWQTIAGQSDQNPNNKITPENLAYTIYTSGSTGRPKGTMIVHQGLVNYLNWCTEAYTVSQGTGAPVHSSLAFDLTITGLFSPLLVGCKVEILPEDRSIENLCTAIRNGNNFSLIKLTPAQLALLNQQLAPEELAGRTRAFIIGGENLLSQHLTLWQTYAPETALVNEYGPTETVVGCCIYTAPPDQQLSGSVPIGRPIANMQIYILDCQMQPLPVGVPGELYIGGAALARGYLKRPDLTAEKFVPHPFSLEAGARLYRSGDLARHLPDGNIEYLGRIDEQVKVRGYRIELGEIESLLRQHEAVREAVILPWEQEPGQQRLVAYMVSKPGLSLTVKELRNFLQAQLPEYMVPATFIYLKALPLTSNGKVDRRALPAPDTARPLLEEAYVAPRNPVEERLTAIWTEVLGLKQVGIYDNFFELGGDSILSIQIIARANQSGIKLIAKQMFQYQTIAGLAKVADTTSVMAIAQSPVTGKVLLTPIQQWFFEQELPQPQHYNQAILLQVRQTLDIGLLGQAVQHLLGHHDALRLRFSRSTIGWLQVNAPEDALSPCLQVDLSALPEALQPAALQTAADRVQASLNLSDGPVVRVALFNLGSHQPCRLLLVIHHLVVDGVSWRILLEDLQTVYQQIKQNQSITLAPKTTSFQQWAEVLNEYVRSQSLEQELSYWLAEPRFRVHPIPRDYPQSKDNTGGFSNTVSVTLDAKDTNALLKNVSQAYRTQINDVLLTALLQVLSSWSGDHYLLVDLEGHGRENLIEDIDISRTIGWFTTVFPVLLELEAADNLGEVLKSVKEQLRWIPNQGIGYGLLRYLKQDTAITEQLQNLPQAEILFNYLGQFDSLFLSDSMFKLAQESSGSEQSLQNSRSHVLEINALVVEGKLKIDWTYSETIHQRSTIEKQASQFVKALIALINHCESPEAGGFTPSDFPLAKIDQQTLDNLLLGSEDIEDIYPLSPAQEGILFHTLYAPTSEVYFNQTSCTLQGNLNISAFKQAWNQVVKRHSILRTAFFWQVLNTPLQVVFKEAHLPFEQQNWQGIDLTKQQTDFKKFLQADRDQGFDLTTAPLMRLALIQLDEKTYQFMWSNHHLLLDGWSTSLVLKEVFGFYEAYCQRQDLNLESSRPYKDYISWLQQQELTKAEAFWRQTLSGFSEPTPLNINKAPTSLVDEDFYDEQKLQLSALATSALQSLARHHQLTLNTFVQGAWALLLSRYSNQFDVVFGATVSGRPPTITGVESLVGLFINTLPLRVQILPEALLLDWLTQLQIQQAEMLQYDYSPLVQVQGWSDLPRGASLFESIVVFENQPFDESLLEPGGRLKIGNISAVEQTNYRLTLTAVPGTRLSLNLGYNCRHFTGESITLMLENLQTILEAVTSNPTQKLSEIPLISESQKQLLLTEWNQTQTEYPKHLCIHQLIETVA
ncbi:amino acid adenylation domain-containing protein, partial [Nostoc flagelliforme FACHB-838]